MKAEGRAVVDTNVLISAALVPASVPATIVQWLLQHGRLVFSRETFAEFETRLWRPKFDRYLTMELRRRLLHDFNAAADWVEIGPEIPRLSRDPDDDRMIATAVAGQAGLLVSGDRDLLELHPVGALQVLNPADALRMLSAEPLR